MAGLAALDPVLRILLARMMGIAFVVHGFGIPTYVAAYFECCSHKAILSHLPAWSAARGGLLISTSGGIAPRHATVWNGLR